MRHHPVDCRYTKFNSPIAATFHRNVIPSGGRWMRFAVPGTGKQKVCGVGETVMEGCPGRIGEIGRRPVRT